VAGFRPQDVGIAITERRLVRLALMRATIFLVDAADAVALRPIMQPAIDRSFAGNPGRRMPGTDLAAVHRRAADLLAGTPLTFSALGQALAADFPTAEPADLAAAARTGLALVQVPPRGVWGASGSAQHVELHHWLGPHDAFAGSVSPAIAAVSAISASTTASNSVAAAGDSAALERTILRYLAAFGPATAADVQTWSGLTGMRAVLDRMAPNLRLFADEHGRQLFDVVDGLLPDAETPAPIRILAEFDNVLLSHQDRTRVVGESARRRLSTVNGLLASTFLIDGYVAGVCRIQRGTERIARTTRTALRADTAVARFEPFHRLRRKDQTALLAEGRRLLRFIAPGARHEAVIAD
jgi:hypothetical protein